MAFGRRPPQPVPPGAVRADSKTVTVWFDGAVVTVDRHGPSNPGVATYALGQLSGVVVSPPHFTQQRGGRFTLVLAGGVQRASLRRRVDAADDPLTVVFLKDRLEAFEALAGAIRQALGRGGAAVPAQPAAAGGGDLAAQLAGLADLHQRGVLSDGEFAAAKARLLGEGAAPSEDARPGERAW